MTAREMLREVAKYASDGGDGPCGCGRPTCVVTKRRQHAAALRALADRLDAEMARVLANEQEARDTDQTLAWTTATIEAEMLARLDAPSGRVMP